VALKGPADPDLTLADIKVIAARQGGVLVPIKEHEETCARLASLSAEFAEADGEFDKILYQ
jgi:hypothetical protein